MKIATVDIAYLQDAFLEQAEQLIEQWRCQPPEETRENPTRLVESMGDLCQLLRGIEEGGSGTTPGEDAPDREIEALGNYGLELLLQLSELATELGMAECSQELENLCLPMATWIARHGGEVRQLPPVINALARHANQTTNPQHMLELYNLATEIFEAVSPHLIENAPEDPASPWRLLVINRAIVATRTLEPSIMEPAFRAVVEYLPEDAPRFFEEGMRQMDIIGYPDRVRELMSHFNALFDNTRTLH